MTRKTAARGRKKPAASSKTTGRPPARTASRAASRTGKKTASARASHPAAGATLERRTPPAAKTGVRAPKREVKPDETRVDQIRTVHAEEDEDLDWLNEDEDPRSQIVEGDDDWDPNHDEEW